MLKTCSKKSLTKFDPAVVLLGFLLNEYNVVMDGYVCQFLNHDGKFDSIAKWTTRVTGGVVEDVCLIYPFCLNNFMLWCDGLSKARIYSMCCNSAKINSKVFR